MADLLGRIERLLEDAVEGTSRRLFRAQLQPVELAKAASRAMQAQQVVGPDGPEVPNVYRILLNPADYDRFAPYRHTLEGKILAYLERFAADRGLQPVAGWRVELVSDPSIRSRAIAVEAAMSDFGEELGRPHAPPDVPEGTLAARPVAATAASAALVAEDGRRFTLREGTTTIGRALDNDVVIADARVSRYHAEVSRVGRDYVVRDLGSTNGTAVAGRRATEQPIRHGDRISIGGYTLSVQLDGASG